MITGTTIGLFCLIINAVPFLPGAKGLVVPWGNVITQFPASALVILRVSPGSRPLRISPPSDFHVRFTVIAPARLKNFVNKLLFIVSSAATYFILVKGHSR